MHAETQNEVALMAGQTGLLEELPYEFLSPSDHHSNDHFATCSVSVACSYEGTAIIDPSKKNSFPPTATGEGSPVVETDFQVTPTFSIVPPNQCMNVLGPAEKSDRSSEAFVTYAVAPETNSISCAIS